MTFLVTAQGKPFSPAGFTNWFRALVREASLPDGLSPHGLRKATCRRLAEEGCTPHQIMAISGQRSLAEVTRYTVTAGRKQLASQAMLALGKTIDEQATGTADKFAQIVREKRTNGLLGVSDGSPPDLIIQDELHLISGPLGTIAGAYEAAFDLMFAVRGHRAKVIGSTATIRRASEQVLALFDREAFQFPPPAIDHDDSGFAVCDRRPKAVGRRLSRCHNGRSIGKVHVAGSCGLPAANSVSSR